MKLIDLLVQELPSRGGWPKGATFSVAYDDGKYVWFFMENNYPHQSYPPIETKFLSDIGVQVTAEQYEAALAASKHSVWDGKSNPPIGVTCEHCPGGTTQNEWEVVTVLGISERPGGVFIDYWLRKEDGSSYIIGNPYRFRPVRTEAERKREDATAEMSAAIAKYTDMTFLEAIYEAVAAGEIKAFKLAD